MSKNELIMDSSVSPMIRFLKVEHTRTFDN